MDNTVQTDFLANDGRGSISGQGGLAQKLLANGMNPHALRTNDVLYNRDWIAVDRAIIAVARQRLVAIGDLFAAGCTYDLPNALGVTRLEWERISDFGVAESNMSGVTEGLSNRVNFDLNYVPIPITHKDFNINIRALEASRRNGHALDTTQVQLATRIVAENLEAQLFTGGLNVGTQGQVYGYLTAPNAHTSTLAYDWGLAATTGENIVSDFITILTALYADNMFGPYMVYVPNAWFIRFGDDFKANGDRTILERLKAIPAIRDIKPTSNLTDKVVFVQMTPDVVDIVNGIQPMAIQWESHGGMVMNFKVMAILVPRMKSTYSSQSGIAHYVKP